ncbi:hypothetical protein MSAN_02515900 [Mycena sanguinolenta]|uniref:Uncharacterized protein n=1 Tax=Mycena sanguinolenta TaxID=230812 RepID=A0A8H6TWZ5_9AGAR|nr:hypothetical protein MSAN_02515900 [Mycena sanguinolenta]
MAHLQHPQIGCSHSPVLQLGSYPYIYQYQLCHPQYLQLLNLVPDSRQIDQLAGLHGDVAFSPLTRHENGFQPARSTAPPVPASAAAKADFYIPHDRRLPPARSRAAPVPSHAAAKTQFFIPRDGKDTRLDFPPGDREDMRLDLPPDDREDILLAFPLSTPAAVKGTASVWRVILHGGNKKMIVNQRRRVPRIKRRACNV